LLTKTGVNVEQYGGHCETLISALVVVCKGQTDTKRTGGNGYDHPQAEAERCDVAIPSHVGFVG